MMNPMEMIKVKNMVDKFIERHPMLPRFFGRIKPEIKEGTIIEITVTPLDGEQLKANIKVQPEDMEFMELIKNMK